MREIKQLIKNNEPFALMQYNVSFVSMPDEVVKNYEFFYLTSSKKLMSIKLDRTQFYSLKTLDGMKQVIKNKNGCIYEINNFQDYYQKNRRIKRSERIKMLRDENK